MDFPKDQIDELRQFCPDLSVASEGGREYILLQNLKLPEGCKPKFVDALLYPFPEGSYFSKLYFAEKVLKEGSAPNWHVQVRVLERNWVAFSWLSHPSLRLIQMIDIHFDAFST